jgi:hypothetical protein
MKIYEDCSYWEEFDRNSVLVLNDSGRFSYSDEYSSYGGGFGGEAWGSWRQSGDTIFFLTEHVDGFTFHKWIAGQEHQAIERDDIIDLGGGFTMSLRRDKPV